MNRERLLEYGIDNNLIIMSEYEMFDELDDLNQETILGELTDDLLNNSYIKRVWIVWLNFQICFYK